MKDRKRKWRATGAKEIGILASKRFEQGRRKRVVWIQKEQRSRALKSQMNRDIEMKVKILITIKSSRKKEPKLYYYFSPSLASCFSNLV